MDVGTLAQGIKKEVEKVIIGKDAVIDICITAILADGHILLEDLPGAGKTTLAKALALALGCDMKRVQFTPDLLPSDILGMNIYNQKTASFEMVRGPIMTNILLADEINRAIPRTQSALLEAMEERQVTLDGKSTLLPEPFMVLATQNPIESQSTFALPAAQMDRFIIRTSVGYPDRAQEVEMLEKVGDVIGFDAVLEVTNPQKIVKVREEIKDVFFAPSLSEYVVQIVQKTRENTLIRYGASPRATKALYRMGKARAAMSGRDYATPDDVLGVAPYVLNHRVTLSSQARMLGHDAKSVIGEILSSVPVPPTKEEMARGR